MPEARRFLRYVVPRLLSVLEVLVLGLLAWPDRAPGRLLGMMKDLDAGGAVTAFLLSGALGYTLSAVHHTFSWLPWIKDIYAGDYRPFFREALAENLIRTDVRAPAHTAIPRGLSIDAASQAMAALWNESRECSQLIKGASARVDSLTDLMHGAGAAAVGAVLAYMVFAYVACTRGGANWVRPSIAFAVLFGLHVRNYVKLKQHTTRVVEMVFWRELKRRQSRTELLL
jgi:hypothetical protein